MKFPNCVNAHVGGNFIKHPFSMKKIAICTIILLSVVVCKADYDPLPLASLINKSELIAECKIIAVLSDVKAATNKSFAKPGRTIASIVFSANPSFGFSG
jgi:hypothetical protein